MDGLEVGINVEVPKNIHLGESFIVLGHNSVSESALAMGMQ